MRNAPLRTVFAILAAVFALCAHAQDKGSGRLSGSDASFILQATNGGMVEVTLSKAALQNSARSDVKAFANRLVDDHEKAGKELSEIADKLGAPPYKPAIEEHADMKRFSRLEGEKFDDAYIDRMTRDHKGAIAFFEKQASRGDAAELNAFAAKTLPTLKAHLAMVMALAEKKK